LQQRIEFTLQRSVLARAEAEVARVHERQKLAHDFHDGPLQCYNSFLIRLKVIRKLVEKGNLEKVDAEVANMQDIANHQVTEMRMFVRAMQPSEWDGENATSGFRDILKLFQKDTGIDVTFSADDELTMEDQSKFTELLQVFREALNNIQKHARASKAAVIVDQVGDRFRLQIEDNGRGFEFAGAFDLDELETIRLGPSSIKRRVRALGGNLTLRSRPGEGAQLEIEIPV
jgi:two-component system, NarL family, sensor histidine kinase DegS